jgi:hypothetical protein
VRLELGRGRVESAVVALVDWSSVYAWTAGARLGIARLQVPRSLDVAELSETEPPEGSCWPCLSPALHLLWKV